jgi:hypothetical protein
MSKFVVTTTQTIVRKYYVEVDDPVWAHDGIVMNELEEFAQEHFSEDIIDTLPVKEFPSVPWVNVNGATNTFNYTSNKWIKGTAWELADYGDQAPIVEEPAWDMLTLKQFMDLTQYRVTETAEYQWQCYGEHALIVDYWNEVDDYTISIVYDTNTQIIYEACAYNYKEDKAYRLFNPLFQTDYLDEAAYRGIDCTAYDEVAFTNVKNTESFITLTEEFTKWTL